MYIYQAIDMNQSMAGMDFGRDAAYCNQVWICILPFCYFQPICNGKYIRTFCDVTLKESLIPYSWPLK